LAGEIDLSASTMGPGECTRVAAAGAAEDPRRQGPGTASPPSIAPSCRLHRPPPRSPRHPATRAGTTV
jgi:hypothetical protein